VTTWSMLMTLGRLAEEQYGFKKALVTYECARVVLVPLKQGLAYALLLACMAYCYRELKRFVDALVLRKECVELYRSLVGENHPEYATCLHNLGIAQSDQGNTRKPLLVLMRH
jgi:hypothetical protein